MLLFLFFIFLSSGGHLVAAVSSRSTEGPSIEDRCTLMPYLPMCGPHLLPEPILKKDNSSVEQRCSGPKCGFNPALLLGIRGLPGIRSRFNSRMFRYASQLVGEILSREIRRARLPDIIQATQPLLEGHIVLHNVYVARYRCPERVVAISKSPNRILLQLQNYDIGIDANVAGHVSMMIPMVADLVVPSGVLQIDVRGLILEMEITVERGLLGPKIAVTSCSNYVDKRFVSKFVRDLLPNEICKMVPKIMDKQINKRMSSIPQAIALSQFATLSGIGLLSEPVKPDPAFCARNCGMDISANGTKHRSPRMIPGIVSKVATTAPKMHFLCSHCKVSDESEMLQGFAKNLNLNKLNDVLVSVRLLNDYATGDGIAFDLTGEFSPGGNGGTPFGPFPIMFPTRHSKRMIEVIVSDYTINSLLYWAHRKGLISFRVGPETPKYGELLKTSCSDDDDGIDYGDVEKRVKRQEPAAADDEPGGLSDLGICLGDILPALRDHYPKKTAHLNIRATRAPSILFSAKRGGSAAIDIQAEADLFIEGITKKVGTLTALIQINLNLQLRGQKIFGSGEIAALKLRDKLGTLGLPEDGFENLALLGKGMIEKQANDVLAKGIPIHIAQSPVQPFTFYDLQIKLIEHGLYVAGDLTIAPAMLGTLSYSGSCYRF